MLGPGSLFTSIIPNLLIPGVVEAIRASRGRVLFVCALADVQGETWGLTAREHVEALAWPTAYGRPRRLPARAHAGAACAPTAPPRAAFARHHRRRARARLHVAPRTTHQLIKGQVRPVRHHLRR
ncbi:2-phospho-L-lactate transferase CofD family protein [Adlercreutzia equolifaciens]|uniref:2-phospho-L-lactate transferase CofD family protein n=1 Tax=Adlercreutzia equolifaciens TaxID=446660 RepID=UPI0035200517